MSHLVSPWPGLLTAYRDFLPISERTPIVTLHEGNTPLIPADYLSQQIGRGVKVWLKFDGLNPTGSFKDRGMTMAVSKAKEEGSEAIVCASTGNTSAAAAAYGGRAGLRVFVLVPAGYVALGKLAQALIYGAEVIAVEGNFDQAFALVRQVAEQYPITLVNSVNRYRLEGQKTAAFEVCEQLGQAPDWLCIPVGNAGNLTAYWMGFSEYLQKGYIRQRPRMLGFEAAGAAALIHGRITPIARPETIATAIRIGNPASGVMAIAAAKQSGGKIDCVSDDEILHAYRLLARHEGIFCEPASASSVAGLLKHQAEIPEASQIVCVLTGSGLKDPDTALRGRDLQQSAIAPELGAVAKAMGF
ncbi:threonine synthase [Candidatus Cyanaurora vandensis]|uniref:threonine synthase n=1 Tax=Candidatus Cyanaurora vandensis TaxID=2714958 RepID=UPI002580AC25|nr:threonine synthase [Candidatus Cyanaurora vandensis]